MSHPTNDDFTFTMVDQDGNVVTCTTLVAFDDEDLKKSYIVYTDHTYEDGSLCVYAGTYDSKAVPELGMGNTRIQPRPIETEEEWRTIEEVLGKLQEAIATTGTIPPDLFY